jgi:hypothetical protein
MANDPKKLPDNKISVYSFHGTIILTTPAGQYWVRAVGGVAESKPVGNPHILFSIRYIWDESGQVFALPEPFLWRLNTATVAGEAFNYELLVPEVQADDPSLPQAKEWTEEDEQHQENITEKFWDEREELSAEINDPEELDEDEEDIDGDDEDEEDEDDDIDEDYEDVAESEEDLSEVSQADDEISW